MSKIWRNSIPRQHLELFSRNQSMEMCFWRQRNRRCIVLVWGRQCTWCSIHDRIHTTQFVTWQDTWQVWCKCTWIAMLRLMKYVNDTSDRGLVLNPTQKWDGSKDHEFIISGWSDSDYAKDTQTRKSISSYRVLLEGAPVMFKSSTQKSVALSVCKAEQLLYCKNILSQGDWKSSFQSCLRWTTKVQST